ncbi:MAG: NAD-dependent epimerase/dehydratase family protein [Chlorobi bacterium]|nr:NAD-dependent epimerase/dehydratase family protein [Chlorobiota bacterium]
MILVTGGTGLVGAHLLYKLVSAGEKVYALRRKTSLIDKTKHIFSYYTDDYELVFNKVHWIEGNILDYESLLSAFEGIEYVHHCAASVSFRSADKNTLIKTNIEGTANIVNAALESGIKKLLHVSSIGTLGRAGNNGIVTEETAWNSKKTSVYSTSKYYAELEIWRGIAEGLNAVIVNPSIILGPADWNSGSARLFKTMHDGLRFYTSGINGFVDVQDVVNIMAMLMDSETSGEKFILNSENISYERLFNQMAGFLKVNPPKYEATRLMSEIAWRILWIKGLLTGKKSAITKETSETARQAYKYSNKKIVSLTGYDFMKIEDSLMKNSAFFLKDFG